MANKKIHIPTGDVEIIREICKMRKGRASVLAIFNDMKKFVADDYKKKFTVDNPAGLTLDPELDKLRTAYEGSKSLTIAEGTLKNAFGEAGVSTKYLVLPLMVELYKREFKRLVTPAKQSRPGLLFSEEVDAKIADTVNSHCSCPCCYVPTKAAVPGKPGETIVLGKGCMIYGPKEDTPRYDPVNKVDFYGVENGIWLCLKHADLVMGVGWVSFPAKELLRWRDLHQLMVYEQVTGIKSVVAIGFQFESGGRQNAINLLDHVNSMEALFMDVVPLHIESLSNAVTGLHIFLKQELLKLDFPIFIAKQANGIVNICKAFVSITEKPSQFDAFRDTYLVFKKLVGSSMYNIANRYKVPMPARLQLIAPA